MVIDIGHGILMAPPDLEMYTKHRDGQFRKLGDEDGYHQVSKYVWRDRSHEIRIHKDGGRFRAEKVLLEDAPPPIMHNFSRRRSNESTKASTDERAPYDEVPSRIPSHRSSTEIPRTQHRVVLPPLPPPPLPRSPFANVPLHSNLKIPKFAFPWRRPKQPKQAEAPPIPVPHVRHNALPVRHNALPVRHNALPVRHNALPVRHASVPRPITQPTRHILEEQEKARHLERQEKAHLERQEKARLVLAQEKARLVLAQEKARLVLAQKQENARMLEKEKQKQENARHFTKQEGPLKFNEQRAKYIEKQRDRHARAAAGASPRQPIPQSTPSQPIPQSTESRSAHLKELVQHPSDPSFFYLPSNPRIAYWYNPARRMFHPVVGWRHAGKTSDGGHVYTHDEQGKTYFVPHYYGPISHPSTAGKVYRYGQAPSQ